jgi:transcription elongation factor Elf1
MTRQQRQKYLKDPGHCPYCESTDIEGGFVEIDGNMACQTVTCQDCGRRWSDGYKLTNVVEIKHN